MKQLRVISVMVLFLLLMGPFWVMAQGGGRSGRYLRQALEAWERRDMQGAAGAAGRVLRVDPSNGEALLLMADICREQNAHSEELIYLRRAATAGAGGNLLDFRLGEALFLTASYGEALETLTRFLASQPRGTLLDRATTLHQHALFAAFAIQNPVPFQPVDPGAGVNSPLDEYWPSLTVDGNTLVFTRRVPVTGAPAHRQEDFFMSRFDGTQWSDAVPLAELNSPANEGAPSLSADGKLLFFTLCNHPGGFGSCDLWFSRFEKGKWTPPRNAGEPVNTAGWEGQPSLSAFGDQLFFSSERSGGKGKKDLWVVPLLGWRKDGTPLWGGVVNAGDSINTPGDEISPFLHPGGRDLFFASDYWPGFGGYDLFRAVLLPGEIWSSPANLGFPVNSPGNEQGLVTDRSGVHAWFATGREQGAHMDICSFELPEAERPSPVSYIRGKVVDDATGMPVAASVNIRASSPSPFPGMTIPADQEGTFLAALPTEVEMVFTVEHPGFLFYSERFAIPEPKGIPDPVVREIRLKPARPGTSIDLYQIFFALNAHEILPPSEPELRLLLRFLRENPTLRVEIGGHTDSTGGADFNRELSRKRAASVRDYLVSNGIDAGRLTWQGYGMDHPVASNETEEGRSLNRRTTISVIK